MVPTNEFLTGCRRAVSALSTAADEIAANAPDARILAEAGDRGVFSPEDESALLSWFARFLTVRSGLWEVVGDVSAPLDGSVDRVVGTDHWRCFVLGYTAACLIVRLDRLLLEEVARDPLTQRKLNEGSQVHRIPRKQYTAVFESFTDPGKARAMEVAMQFAARNRVTVEGMKDDRIVDSFVVDLPEREVVLEPSRRRYVSLLVNYLLHAFRRRGASARHRGTARIWRDYRPRTAADVWPSVGSAACSISSMPRREKCSGVMRRLLSSDNCFADVIPECFP